MGAGPHRSTDASSVGPTSRDEVRAQIPDSLPDRDRIELAEILSTTGGAPSAVITQILEYSADRLNLAQGTLAEIRPGPGTLTVVSVGGRSPLFAEGATRDLSTTYCRKVVTSGGLVAIEDASTEGWNDDPARNSHGVECYIGHKVLQGTELYGTVSFSDTAARSTSFSPEEQALVTYVARLLGKHPGLLNPSPVPHRAPPKRTRGESEASVLGGWELTADDHTLRWTDQTCRIHEVPPDYEPTPDSALEFFQPESRSALRDAIFESLDTGAPFELELSLITAKNTRRRVRVTGVPQIEQGSTTRILGTIRDITTEEKRHRPYDPVAFQNLVQDANPIFVMLDANGRILVSEGKTLGVLGLRPGEHVGGSVYDLFADTPELIGLVDRSLSGEQVHGRATIDDTILELWFAPYRRRDGTVAGCIGMATDITAKHDTETALREREAQLRSITENVREGIYRASPDDGLVYVNSAFVDIFGYESADDVLGLDPEQLCANPERRNPLLHIVDGASTEIDDVTFRRNDGSTFLGRLSGSVVRNEEDEIQYVDGVVVDISEEMETQRELQETKARYRSISEDVLDTSPVGTFILDSEFTIVWINAAIEEYFGVLKSEVIGMDKQDFLHEYIPDRIEDAGRFIETVTRTYERNEAPETFECHILPGENRSERWLEHQSIPIEHGWYEGGRVETYTDVTRLKDREQTLRRERDLLNRIFQTSPSAIAVFNREGDFIRISDRAQEILGIDKNAVRNRTFNDPAWEITAPDGSPFPEDELPFARVKTTEEPVIGVEHAIHWPDGTRRVLSVSGAPLHDDAGSFEGAVFHIDDITEQRRIARNLRKSEERFRGLFESAALGVALIEDTGRIIEVNPALASMLGYTAQELQGRHFEEVTHSEDTDRDKELYDDLVAGNRETYQMEKRYIRKDGETFWGRLTVSRRDTPGDVEIVGMVENIDARKRRKKELRKFQKVVEQAHEAVLILEGSPDAAPGPKITYANPAFTSLTGYTAGDVIGKRLQILHGPDTESWVLEALWSSFERGQRHEGEAINYRKDGSRFVNRWGLAPVRNEDGTITHWVFVQRDVTEERRMDRRLLHVEDEERRRIDAEMHDQVGGLLTTLQMTVELGRMKAEEAEAVIEQFDQIESLVDELSSVTRTISRRLHPQVLDDHGLNRALAALATTFENEHDLEMSIYSEVDPGERLPPLVEMTAYRVIQESLVNIVRHAETDSAQVLLNKGDTDLRIHIIDQGKGFETPEDIDASNRGLQGIVERVERLNGDLEITTAPGEGTRISATLPIGVSTPPPSEGQPDSSQL